MEEHTIEEEKIEEKQENDQETQSLPQDVIYPKGHSKDEIIGDVSQEVRTRSERRFEEIFTHEEVLERHDDRTMNKLDAYGRLLHHRISNIIIPNVGHKSSMTNMHSFVMLALHEHRMMNFGFMAIEHMLATQSSSTKCLRYGCFITKIFQHFVINLVGVGDHIGHGKIYNQNTFKRMGFERNDDGLLIRGGQQGSDGDNDDDDEDDGDEEEGNDPEIMDEEDTNEEDIRREMSSKKR
ncbi:hypothetical protein M9H77_03104 [Catharanthus roseus]|uniref:Uncharacterized protein n=1 Tax=Catharanthus roseus TaxID=4058 RepID=A0ACC0CAC0_CATRO|nr:hypothetical protein M9H77_03104 [Catharanthus roseus]